MRKKEGSKKKRGKCEMKVINISRGSLYGH